MGNNARSPEQSIGRRLSWPLLRRAYGMYGSLTDRRTSRVFGQRLGMERTEPRNLFLCPHMDGTGLSIVMISASVAPIAHIFPYCYDLHFRITIQVIKLLGHFIRH